MAEEQDSYLGQGLKRTLTPQEYQTSFVDFYTQTLGRTGVEVEQPDDEKEEDKKEYVAPQIITDSGGDDFVSYGQMGQGTKELDIKPLDVIGMKQLENINSYSDLLKSQNQKDIVELDNFDFSSFISIIAFLHLSMNSGLFLITSALSFIFSKPIISKGLNFIE